LPRACSVVYYDNIWAIHHLLDFVLPRRCAVCGRIDEAICEACLAALVKIVPPWCERCGTPGPWPVRRCAECSGRRLAFTTARAAIVYDERARSLIRSWKEHGRRDVAEAAADLVGVALPAPRATALAFVPADPDRRLRRGHAAPEGLARGLGRRWNLPVEPLLHRTRVVAPQRGLTLPERRRNVAGAFAARGRVPADVCLVDDVYTTGATAHACASALRRAGARQVGVVALARAVR
jgi:predicted amidophosphoribosyltransferase